MALYNIAIEKKAFDLVLYPCSDRATVTDVSPNDLLRLEVAGIPVDLLTGIHSEETHLPQPLLISITADLEPTPEYRPQTPLGFSKDYLDLRNAALQAIPRDLHFTLIESIADHIANTLFAGDVRVRTVSIKIVKVAISESGEAIGMTLIRHRHHWHEAAAERALPRHGEVI